MADSDAGPIPLLTIGHGQANRAELTERLRDAGVRTLVDVRRFPGSRRNPDVGHEVLRDWLPAHDVEYVWDERLGGRRRLSEGRQDTTDSWWQNESFRAYAAHTRTAEFADAIGELVTLSQDRVAGIMCSESVWWRCHRRIIADLMMLIHQIPVVHLMPDGRRSPHQPSAGARVQGGTLTYPVG